MAVVQGFEYLHGKRERHTDVAFYFFPTMNRIWVNKRVNVIRDVFDDLVARGRHAVTVTDHERDIGIGK